MSRTRILGLLRTGFLYGAIFYGGTISVVHVLYNRLPGGWDALVLTAYLTLLFGLPTAVVVAVSATLFSLRRSPPDASREGLWARGAEVPVRDLVAPLAIFHFLFFVPFLLYGLTYDQTLVFHPTGPWAMVAYLASACLAIALASRLLAAVAARVACWLAARRGRSLGALTLVLLAVLVPAIAFRAFAGPDAPGSAVPPVREPSAVGRKVVFIGLDGADWQVLDRLGAQGELPTFDRLQREGARADLQTIAGANSAEIWASIYTGTDSTEHRCRDFYRIQFLGMGAGFYPVHRTFVQEASGFLGRFGLANRRIIDRSCLWRRPLWEVLDDLGLSTGIVDGYYYSVPAPTLQHPDSYVFSYALNVLGPAPGGLEERREDEISTVVRPAARLEDYLPHRSSADFYWQSQTLLEIVAAEGQPDYLQLYTHQPDAEQHQSWREYEPQYYFSAEPSGAADRIPQLYRDFDAFLSRLLPLLEPETLLVIASDHGHSPTLVHPYDTQHRHGPPGILILWGNGVLPSASLDHPHVVDLVPTLFSYLGLPIADDFDGRVLAEALQSSVLVPGTIESYEPFGPKRTSSYDDEGLNEGELEKLRNMGYIN